MLTKNGSCGRLLIGKKGRKEEEQRSGWVYMYIPNLGLTILAASRYGSDEGFSLIYERDCETVHALDQWIHLLINLLGTGMLSASNYYMQLQAAPTRASIDRARRDNRWLDIGILSVRNLRYISNWRRLSWALLALSSLPIHLMYVIERRTELSLVKLILPPQI